MPQHISLLSQKLSELSRTPRSRERDTHPTIKSIFCTFLGHCPNNVHTDMRTATGGVPDVYVDVVTNGMFLERWAVLTVTPEGFSYGYRTAARVNTRCLIPLVAPGRS